MNKIRILMVGILSLFLCCCTNHREEMMENTSKIEKGMTKNEVEKILQTKPDRIFKRNIKDRGEFIICLYDLGHPYDYSFVVTYSDDKDSIVLSRSWQ